MSDSEPPDDTVAKAAAGMAAGIDRSANAWLVECPALGTTAGLVRLSEELTNRLRVDIAAAERIGQVAESLSDAVSDGYARARVRRAMGHVHALRRRFDAALEAYRMALGEFDAAPHDIDAAITRSGAIQTLIYLGRYDDALAWAAAARRVFERHGDALRVARLDTNVGNILYRRDDFAAALDYYTRALAGFRDLGEPQDFAIALRNLAVCHISLHDFPRAIAAYEQARAWCESKGLAGLIAKLDYNIAYLFYQRGEYARALELYQLARQRSVSTGDRYHAALCDLDQAELYLEINLVREGLILARRAEGGFATLRVRYERAKAMVNVAVAEHLLGHPRRAERRFRRARRLFRAEKNVIWLALVDLYRALNLEHDQPRAARRLADAARSRFSRVDLVTKQTLSELLLARLRLREGRVAKARELALAARHRVERVGLPSLAYQAAFTLGVIADAEGDRDAAYQAYRMAHERLEQLRGGIGHDELKIAFLKDKREVFERLVASSIERDLDRPDETFAWIEQGKSRALADRLAAQAHALPLPVTSPPELLARWRGLREELRWCSREVERLEARHEPGDWSRIEGLRREAQRCEGELVRLFQEFPGSADEFLSLQTAEAVPLAIVQQSLPPDELLIEFYQARGRIYAVAITSSTVDVVDLASVAEVHSHVQYLRLQFSKFGLGTPYLERHAASLCRAARFHLEALYRALMDPLRKQVNEAAHLIVVPDGQLHGVPFHALWDGSRYVMDRHSISYAPSATVLHYCRQKAQSGRAGAVVLGVTDPGAPEIASEVKAVAGALPDARLWIGDEATTERLRNEARDARFVHVATHGRFRSDNPLFSAIRLADQELTLLDLYQLQLRAELVTLSGCATGASVVREGDELIGLTRGLLFAGAHAVMVSLWDVHDASTAVFMSEFYGRIGRGQEKRTAVTEAMRVVRAQWPHPYYWAPFVLVGRCDGATRG